MAGGGSKNVKEKLKIGEKGGIRAKGEEFVNE